ncbi:MAG: ATP-binding protein [Anaeromyxobacteraceae bacterium]
MSQVMSPGRLSALKAYGLAVLSAILGLAVTTAVAKPLAGPFFMFQFAAVVGAALYGGVGPGLLTMVLSGAGFYAVFFAPALEAYEAFRLASFVLVSVFFAWLASRMRDAKTAAEAARARAEAAEAEARTVAAQQERLVAVVSHDLRSPLNAIAVTLKHLQQVGGLTERQTTGVARVGTCTRRMESIVRDLLDYARARHASGIPVERRPARLGEVCRGALDEVRTAHATATVLIEVTGDDTVSLDPARIEQVVCNLVTNALKHGARDVPVTVAVAEEGADLRIEVTNEGTPIAPRLIPVLFDPFRSGDAKAGLGLGLFIVREIARAHGGSVAVRSDARATTFTVLLPRSAPPALATAAPV